MFRGEPLAFWTIISGFVVFLVVQLFGLAIVGVFNVDWHFITQSHFFLAFLGWLGLVVMGAQLQFYRAITGVRKFEPEYLRWAFLGSVLIGLILMVYGDSFDSRFILILGFVFYGIGVGIHLYWTVSRVQSKYFKFPLDYFLASQIYFVIGLSALFWKLISSDRVLVSDILGIRHIFLFGWISLTLQGALIRIMPMFLGKNIDRPSRKYLPLHFWFSSISSGLFIIAFISDNINLIRPFSTFWLISWIWTFVILAKSIKFSNLEYKETLLFFVPGMIYLSAGALIGFYMVEQTGAIDRGIRDLHIHLSLVAGLSLIMLGAIHRITAFQLYTILYTGKRDSNVSLKDFLYLKYVRFVAIILNIGVIYFSFEMYKQNYTQLKYAGMTVVLGTLLYSGMIVLNCFKYFKEKKNAIPFWLKSTEAKSE